MVMNAVLSDIPPTRFRLTVEQYHRMVELGILREDERVELIDGELVRMAPIGSMHGGLVSRLTRLLVERVGRGGVVSPQNAVILSDFTEPQPDLAVLRWRADDYMAGTPRAGDTLLVIEVADSSLRFDRDVKLRFYALAGVPEAWIVDVRARRVLRFTLPDGEGYRSSETLGPGATARCAGLSTVMIGMDELFA
ncbi:MAG: hypothetical protein RIS35_3468 [Pseudomonadota bacterium]|jgi:Uma2 family endonuclease